MLPAFTESGSASKDEKIYDLLIGIALMTQKGRDVRRLCGLDAAWS